MTKSLFKLVVTALVFAFGCAPEDSGATAQGTPLAVEPVVAMSLCNQYMEPTKKGIKVLTDKAAFEAELTASGLGLIPPEVDFAKKVAVAVHLGEKPDCAYSIDVTGARELATSVVVEVTVTTTTSTKDCSPNDSPSNPVALALLPKRDKRFTFMELSASKVCSP